MSRNKGPFDELLDRDDSDTDEERENEHNSDQENSSSCQIAMQIQPLPCLCDQFNPPYSPPYRPDLKRTHSGFSESDNAFQIHYALQIPNVNLECMRCCLLYLRSRGYTVTDGANNFVFYPDFNLGSGVPIFVPPIAAFLNIPKGAGIRGQIATGCDYNLGKRTVRLFGNSRTYQMYSPTGALSVGFVGPSRMESIAIDVVKREELKDIQVNYSVAVLIEQYRIKVGRPTLFGFCSIRNLIEVRTDTKEAIFQKLDSPRGDTETFKFDFLHVTPPMSTPDPVRDSPLVDSTGFVDIARETLQHIKSMLRAYTIKLNWILNMLLCKLVKRKTCHLICRHSSDFQYDGYSSCPVITSRGKCILVEFNYDCFPLETFPFNQAKERRSMYLLKKNIIPQIYWHMMLRGLWNGPNFYEK